MLLVREQPLLFVGPTGTGKSAITNSFLLQLPKEKYISNNINFSAQTSANQTQDIIFSKLDRFALIHVSQLCMSGGVFNSLRFTIVDVGGACMDPPLVRSWSCLLMTSICLPRRSMALSLLLKSSVNGSTTATGLTGLSAFSHGLQVRVYLISTQKLFACRKDTSVLELVDIIMVAAMGPPGGGRNSITPRFLRHFNVISIDSFNEDTMKNIFNPICDWHFNQGFDAAFKKFSRVCQSLCY